METKPETLEFWPVVLRGLARRCPCCGKGKLFCGYLKQVDACSVCGERYADIRADDGPAWLTILLVGHIMAPILLTVLPRSEWPDEVHMTLWPLLTLILSIAILPRAKGFFIGMIWRTGATGNEK